MTLISVVVPVYKVQGYLRQCLDSVLNETFTDVEVIAVDDCSPDGSGRILAEYADRDPRVKVVTLAENVGLGRARNVGLTHATGDYVWFLDSDDYLDRGALGAVARRLADTDPDVLIVGWDRVHWNGRVEPGSARKLMARAPRSFSVDSWLPSLNILHVAWNKLVKRDWLVESGLEFSTGWYEDVSFTFPLLARARRVSTLGRTCVHYRQRRTGAITRTVGDRHFEVFDHWERTFELIGHDPVKAGVLQPMLFRRMIWHYLSVLRHRDRVPRRSRAAFFRRMQEHYRRYLPPGGYPVPSGAEGIRHRIVARGNFLTFETLRVSVGVARRGRRLVKRVLGTATAAAKWLRRAAFGGWYQVQRLLPIDPKLALFAAYWYRGVACSPAAIHAKARELAPGVRGVWVVSRNHVKALPPGTDHVVAGTLGYYRALARAKYFVNNVNWPAAMRKRPGTVHVMTHHGTPLKRMGLDQVDHPAAVLNADIAGQMRRVDRWDYSVTANAHTTEAWDSAYPGSYTTLETGYPRNDRLVTATREECAVIRQKLGIAPDETVVLYAPTHREWLPPGTPVLDVEDFAERLGPKHVLLVRAHYFYVPTPGTAGKRTGNVLDVSAYPAVEDLYLVSDVLVTDYSSAMFDYAVLDRPVVVHAPDWPVYRELRGVYFDVLAEPPGAVAQTYSDLVDLFVTGAYADDSAAKARAHFRVRFCALEDGGAAERVVRRVLPVDYSP